MDRRRLRRRCGGAGARGIRRPSRPRSPCGGPEAPTGDGRPAQPEPPGEELALALEEARAETASSRRLSEIATTIDLDAVLERTLAAAVSTDGIDAAMAVVGQTEETPLVATPG